MKELFKKWLEKLACRHEWTIIAKTSYTDCNRYLLVCSKCVKGNEYRPGWNLG